MNPILRQVLGVALLLGGVATHVILKGVGELPTLAIIVIGGLMLDPDPILKAIAARFHHGDE